MNTCAGARPVVMNSSSSNHTYILLRIQCVHFTDTENRGDMILNII